MSQPFEEGEATNISFGGPRAVKRTARAHLLEVVSGPGELCGQKYSLDLDQMVLGRGSEVSLHIKSEALSRTHAQLTRRHGEFRIEDLNSRNGIYLNGLRIHSAVLRDGDQLQLGDLVLQYREG